MKKSILFTAMLTAGLLAAFAPGRADDLKDAEARRIAVVAKAKPSVVSVFGLAGWGGGSGVLIDDEGYALTNAHVVQPTGPVMRCGLSNGELYYAVLVGLDKVGDVALIKLLPKKPGDKFPFARMGDSDKVRPGDWSLAMGNPFVLATDFNPTVTFGLISGVNRYQHPSGGFLEYTDCIQTDTSINPGNSGGPLFNMDGEVVGINGRIMFAMEKRVRINCGHGYAISINQIKNFLGHFHAGIDTDHATLGATFQKSNDEQDLNDLIVNEVLDDSDAKRRGLMENDILISFAGRPVNSVNQYKNILGIFPQDWRVPVSFRRGNDRRETLVRLLGYQPSVEKKDEKEPQPKQPAPKGPKPPEEAAKLVKVRKGFANYHFNEQERKRLFEDMRKLGDYSKLAGNWTMTGVTDRGENRMADFKAVIADEKDKEGRARTVVKMSMNTEYTMEPVKLGQSDVDRMEPPTSGGFMMAVYNLRRLLTLGPAGFEGDNCTHGGHEPIYPMPLEGPAPKSFNGLKVMTEVLRTEHADVRGKWYFYRKDLNPDSRLDLPNGSLLAFEIFVSRDHDPCEVYCSNHKMVDGKLLPTRMEVRFGDKRYAVVNNLAYKFEGGAK